MERSETIGKLAEALAKAQGQITGARKDSENPFFKSKYSDLASVWDAIRPALSANGLSVVQTPYMAPDGTVGLTTILMHASGEYIQGNMCMKPLKPDPQSLGSGISYLRRYCISAYTGVAQVDDDGNEASQPKFESKAVTKKYDMHPGEAKDVPESTGMDEQHLDEAVLIADLKKAIADDMRGFSKTEKKLFYEWYITGKGESVDVLQAFRDNYTTFRAQYIEHLKEKAA